MPRGDLKEPPDGGWGWLVVIGGMYCLSIWGGIMRCYSVFYDPMMTEFQAEYGTVAWLNGMFQINYGLFTVIGPLAMRRFECRSMSLVASAVCGLSCFLGSFCEQLWAVQVCMGLIVGGFIGIISISMFTTVTRYFKKRLHTANQLLCLGVSVGPLLVCPGYQYLTTTFGWRGATRIVAGTFLNMAVASALLRPIRLQSDLEDEKASNGERKIASKSNKPEPKFVNLLSMDPEVVGSQSIGLYTPTMNRKIYDSNGNIALKNYERGDGMPLKAAFEDDEDSLSAYSDNRPFRERLVDLCRDYQLTLFADKRFYLYTFSWTFFGCAFYSASTYIIPFGEKELGLTEFEASTLVSAFAGGSLFSRVTYALFFDRMPMNYRILYVCVWYGFLSLAMLLLPFMPGYISAMVCCVSIGAFGGGLDGVYSAFIAEIFSVQHYALVFGYSNIITHSTGTLTTVLVGVIVDKTESLRVPFYIGCGTAAIASFLVFLLHKTVMKIRRDKAAAVDDTEGIYVE